LTLWHAGEALINAAASLCKNTIVTMHTVGPVLVESWIDNPNITGVYFLPCRTSHDFAHCVLPCIAVIAAGLPGQESGNAITDILFGAVSPSGKLPYTIARQRTDYPAEVVYTSTMQTPQITYSEKLEIDYRHFDAKNISPRFEFGFGLSYTTVSAGIVTYARERCADGFRCSLHTVG
jgi:beta-glucosidase